MTEHYADPAMMGPYFLLNAELKIISSLRQSVAGAGTRRLYFAPDLVVDLLIHSFSMLEVKKSKHAPYVNGREKSSTADIKNDHKFTVCSFHS